MWGRKATVTLTADLFGAGCRSLWHHPRMRLLSLAFAIVGSVALSCGAPQTVADPAPVSEHRGLRASAAPDDGPRRLALLVGIDAYGPSAHPGVPPEDAFPPLAGARRDVAVLAAVLRRRGFEVRTLVDADATRAGIERAFRSHLIDGVRPDQGDVALFHFSGHGQQVPDDRWAPDEVDGYDEALVPWDNRGTLDPAGHLRDDDLRAWLVALSARAGHVVVTLDACHSGTGTRALYATRGIPPQLPPSPAAGARPDAGPSGWLGGDPRGWVVLSAARSDQQAGEARAAPSGEVMGAFTHQLVRALHLAGPQTTYRDLLARVRVAVLAERPGQEPQLDGDGDRVLFSGRWRPPPAGLLVRPPDASGRLSVEAGAVHGLAAGAELALFPLDARALDPATAVAHAIVTSVEPTFAYAELRSTPIPAALSGGARAAVTRTSFRPDPLRVRVDVADGHLATALQALRFVTLVTEPAPWDVRITEDPSGSVGLEGPSGHALPIPVGAGAPPQTLVSPGAALAPRVQLALESHYRLRRLSALSNRDPRSRLEVRFEVVSLRVDPLGPDRLTIGDRFRLRAYNDSDRRVFVRILALNADGSVDVAYPGAGDPAGEDALEPGAIRTFGAVFRAAAPVGRHVFKLIASERPFDIGALRFSVDRAALPPGASPLERLLVGAFDGRRAVPFGYAPVERWGTAGAVVQVVEPPSR